MGGIGLERMEKMKGDVRMMLKTVSEESEVRAGEEWNCFISTVHNAWDRKTNTNSVKT